MTFPNKTEDLSLSVFDKITGINESKKFTLTIIFYLILAFLILTPRRIPKN